jgi:hypothetical protein
VNRPVASLSLDLDNLWSYMKTHGDHGWESFPSYLDVVVPRVLRILQERSLTITFFVVGQDAALERNHAALREIALAGHEIGNHSFRHEPWLHLYPESEIDVEIQRAEEAIEHATGLRPHGFRGPGFSLSEATLRVLRRRGYQYDASTFPTYLGPLARAYYFMTAKLTPREKEERRLLFGSFAEGRRPITPYRWRMNGETLLEIPVTTMPMLRTPIHVSYLLYASLASSKLASVYFRTALQMCQWMNTEPSVLLHPLDFLGKDDVRELSFFPAMGLPGKEKADRSAAFLDLLAERFQIITMREHAALLERRGNLPQRTPRFSHPGPGTSGTGGSSLRAPSPVGSKAPVVSSSSPESERSIR